MSDLAKRAYEVYQLVGASAVFDLARTEGIKDWRHCEPCEEMTPSFEEACLVCGTQHPPIPEGDSAVTDAPDKFFTNKKFDDYGDAVRFAKHHGSQVESLSNGWYVVHYWTNNVEGG